MNKNRLQEIKEKNAMINIEHEATIVTTLPVRLRVNIAKIVNTKNM